LLSLLLLLLLLPLHPAVRAQLLVVGLQRQERQRRLIGCKPALGAARTDGPSSIIR
jgi:hypothetical protein